MTEGNSRQAIVDASHRFAMRREAAALDAGVNEIEAIKGVMASQPDLYLTSVNDEYSQSVAGALYGILSEGMGVGVLSSDPEAVESDGILPGADFGVVYVKGEKRHVSPRLYLSIGMISLLGKQFHPFLGDDESRIKPRHKIASSAVAGSWFALGKWTIDTIDPRYVQDPESNKDAVKAISKFASIDLEKIDIDKQSEEISNSLLVLSYRMAGAMAYKGFARYLKRENLPYDTSSLSIFQQMQSAYYDRQIKEDTSHITPVNFALAKPLLARDVELVFGYLEPVAKALHTQNRLADLEY